MASWLWTVAAAVVCCLACTAAGIKVNVMLPLDYVDFNGIKDASQLLKDLQKLKSGGVDGVMADVWWGLVELSPKQYNFSQYLQLVSLVEQAGLKWQIVTSFHRCGGNVGDNCNIPLPSWVRSIGSSNPDIWFRDQQHGTDEEYLSLGVDFQSLFGGRTAIQIYKDFMTAFKKSFSAYIKSGTLEEVQVGSGPCGELRYPSYQLSDNKWSYCGIGEFQCYDKYMLAFLKEAANEAGHPEWGTAGPSNAGSYNSQPSQTGFFSSGTDNYASDYGKFFLGWYSEMLLNHSAALLSAARTVFGYDLSVAAKVAGIHWWYADASHAAECAAGYFNTDSSNAYLKIAQTFANYKADYDFTCLEMLDSSDCGSRPQELVQQNIKATQKVGIKFDGENGLDICNPTCYQSGFDEIYKESTQYGNINAFTYLRMTRNLLDNSANWNMFTSFVKRMHSA
eukprot:TRINITY_DN18303_c0_g1_i1.p1 TRINITY_DN18303_c0_g1~~TRINITY_DN18303_c0_g1_i1.p1  ORF type:complete len:458 (-),score=123.58 TRINITY_DN18303_c0_g1_i1:94-1443(-)